MTNGNGSYGILRSILGLTGVLVATGIVGTVAMYGQLQGALVRIEAQEQHIEVLDRRVQQCENAVRRHEEAFARQP